MGEEGLVNAIILCISQARMHILPSPISRNRNGKRHLVLRLRTMGYILRDI